jgi:hypothetical protein
VRTPLLAIDPGPVKSAYVIYDGIVPTAFGWVENAQMRMELQQRGLEYGAVAIEMIASYGMSVGQEVFETCVWVGRFCELLEMKLCVPVRRITRKEAVMHICMSPRGSDSTVRTALIDRWGGKDLAIGCKKAPGPLYGLVGDCWAALAVAVTAAETPP